MRRVFEVSLVGLGLCVLGAPLASAGTLTAQGGVVALDDVNQLQGVVGTADFGNALLEPIALNLYEDEGMLFHTGQFAQILMGVNEPGEATQPFAFSDGMYFPGPIGGGGVAQGSFLLFGGAVTFSDPITQFGATASSESTVYMTAWDTNGTMIGQITWVPDNDSAFIGIDTQGVQIGMLAYGNDDVWNGEAFANEGPIVVTDTWIWASAVPCESELDCEDDENPCTDRVCTDGSCGFVFNEDPCDDGDACTEMDACSEGACVGADLDCNDDNLCSVDSCDPDIGCMNDFEEDCCVVDEDCPEGEVCHFGSNTCIPDPGGDGDGDGDGDTGDGDGDTTTGDGDGDPTTGDGDGDPTTGDGDGDGDPTTGDGDGDPATGDGDSGDTGETSAGGDDSGGDEGCNCTADEQGSGALFGLLGLILLGSIRRRELQ